MVKITDTLKATVIHNIRFRTLSLSVTSLKICAEAFLRLGISLETMEILNQFMIKLSEELTEVANYAKFEEDFRKITEDLKDKPKNMETS